MFILNRQDVEITNISHPSNKDQKIPILLYQGQTFRIMRTFGSDREQALQFWRDLVDNKGKSCILLEEPENSRFSVWGKFIVDKNLVKPVTQKIPEVRPPQISPTQANSAKPDASQSAPDLPSLNQTYSWQFDITLVKACLLILQTIYLEIDDLFGARQVSLFKQDVLKVLLKQQFPQINGMEQLEQLLRAKDFSNFPLPGWDDRQLQILLKELYTISKSYFGNALFLNAVSNALEALPSEELSKFRIWLSKSPSGHIWQ